MYVNIARITTFNNLCDSMKEFIKNRKKIEMIKLICAFNDKEFTIDHREIVNIREFKSIDSGTFCMLTRCRDDGTLIGFIPVRGGWVDIKSKIEEAIGREIPLEEWRNIAQIQ